MSVATAAIGLVIDASAKMASFGMGLIAALSTNPTASWYTSLPLREIAITAPGMRPRSTSCLMVCASSSSRALDSPTLSGLAVGN